MAVDWEDGGLNTGHQAAFDLRQVDQDRTLAAMHRLEGALGSAAPGREEAWRQAVVEALDELQRATAEEASNAERPDSLLSDVARTQPRLRNRVRGLRVQYRQVRDAVGSVRDELVAHFDPEVGYADVRQRLSLVTSALRHQRARESDLIYEAYYEAFRTDLVAEKDADLGGHGPGETRD
ncbi:MAG TPA: hypothetical protein VFN50_05785 [Acidimicrobiales bacterium]|nr:hypothetical protein [Acidimicrobiales bacterium]